MELATDSHQRLLDLAADAPRRERSAAANAQRKGREGVFFAQDGDVAVGWSSASSEQGVLREGSTVSVQGEHDESQFASGRADVARFAESDENSAASPETRSDSATQHNWTGDAD